MFQFSIFHFDLKNTGKVFHLTCIKAILAKIDQQQIGVLDLKHSFI